MSRFTSTNYSEGAFNVASLLVRLVFGIILLVHHGIPKLMAFGNLQYKFPDPFHIGSRWSLCMAIFAEVFCSVLVILGFLTRIALVPLVILLGVALVMIHHLHAPLADTELAWVYFAAFFALLLVGPGRISVDGMTN
jgi:putative oxidoreductase